MISSIEEGARIAARVIERGGIAVYPTDTLYGFGVDPRNRDAVERVYAIKGREEGKPLLLMVRDVAMAQEIAVLPPAAVFLVRRFWPGALSLVVPLRAGKEVLWGTGKDATVGLRAPDHPFREAFFSRFPFPITSTSVNRSGEPPLLDFEKIGAQFGALVDVLVDDPHLRPRGVPSTVVQVEGERLVLVREGAVPRSTLLAALSEGGFAHVWGSEEK